MQIFQQLTACEDDASIIKLFEDSSNYSKLADTGYSKPPTRLTVADKDEITDTLVDYYCTLKVKAGMDQFLGGIKEVGLLDYLQSQPELLKSLFTYTPVTLTTGLWL